MIRVNRIPERIFIISITFGVYEELIAELALKYVRWR